MPKSQLEADVRCKLERDPRIHAPVEIAVFGDGGILPPALLITAEADALRDKAEAYAAKLRLAGVPVTAVRYAPIVHDLVVLDALRDTETLVAATAQAAD
jgi:acetyl esterase/lipase